MKTLNLAIPGFSIACKVWGSPNKPTILALHGWLDNANSFDLIAPYFENDFHFIAIDLPGHGHSSHLPEGCNYLFFDSIFTVIEIINTLKLDKIHLLGHSMGACLASLIAGVVPERFLSLCLIEGLGPFSSPEETACQQLRNYAHDHCRKRGKKTRSYDCLIDAAHMRSLKGYLSLDLAKVICERGLIEKQGQFYWRHDPRLLIPTPLRMTELQILSCLKNISVNTWLLLSSRGFSFDTEIIKNRIKAVKNLTLKKMDGGHHIHMEQPEVVSQLLADFITSK